MPRVPDQYLKQLTDNGIYVSSRYPDRHAGFPAGHALMPYDSDDFYNLAGESIKASDFNNPTDPDQICTYGGIHLLWIYGRNDKWYIMCHHCVPGPGPGDFMHEWHTVEEAVNDALKYFGKDERWQLIEKIERYRKYNFSAASFEKVRGAGLRCRWLGGIDGYRIARTDHMVYPPEDKNEVEFGYLGRVFTDEESWYSEFTPIPPLQGETKVNKWPSLDEALDDAIDFFHNREGREYQ